MLGNKPYSGAASVQLDQVTSAGFIIADGKIKIDNNAIAPGIHQLSVNSVDDKGTTVIGTAQFESTNANDPSTTISRRWKLLSGNQAHPLVDGDTLYVGANDGFFRAIDLKNSKGEFLWEVNLNREILSTPAVSGDAVVVGSMDTNVYSLDKKTGKQNWKFKTNQAVLASLLLPKIPFSLQAVMKTCTP